MSVGENGLERAGSATQRTFQHALALRTGGGQSPLFIVHEEGRDDSAFAELADLLPEGFPIYELRVKEHGQGLPVERLAAHHIATIRTLQSQGPYRILGHSPGGLIAYEIATQLIGLDEQVAFLGMIETHFPAGCPGRSRAQVASQYAPQPLPIPVHLFTAGSASECGARRGWDALIRERLLVSEVDSGDGSILRRPRARQLADVIAAALSAARDPSESLPERAYSPIISIQGSTRSVPGRDSAAFCVPGAGASVTSFLPLAQALGERTSVYGLQPRGLDRTLVPHASVEATARCYIRALKAQQPRGPYRLIGHSFGGWVVFEMACQLLARGDAIEPVILLDSQPPPARGVTNRHYGRVATLIKLVSALEEASGRKISLTRQELEALDNEGQDVELLKAMKSIGLLTRLDAVRALVRVFTTHLNTPYVPAHVFSGRALLIQAKEPSVRRIDDYEVEPERPPEAWRDYLPHLEITSMPGNHMTLLKEPNIDLVAALIREAWGIRDIDRASHLRDTIDGGAREELGHA